MINPGSSSHILRTPLDILDTAREVFPEAAAREIIINRQPTLKLQLWLSHSILPITLASGIRRKQFIIELTWAKLSKQVDDLIGNPRGSIKLRTEDFVIADPLENWKKFRRAVYEQSGRDCTELIISSFFRKKYDKQLYYLELAPAQIDNDPRKSDLAYFRMIVTQLRNTRVEKCPFIIMRFRSRYPRIYQRIIDELSVSS